MPCISQIFVVSLHQILKTMLMEKSVEVITTEQNNDFATILQIIEQNRSQAIQAVNHASLLTAWEVGAYVSNKIENADWGAKVVQQLAEYMM